MQKSSILSDMLSLVAMREFVDVFVCLGVWVFGCLGIWENGRIMSSFTEVLVDGD